LPEGGRQAWLTVLGGCAPNLALDPAQGRFSRYGVYHDYYTTVSRRYQGHAYTWDATSSIQIFLLYASGIISVKLYDQGYFRHLLVAGNIVWLFSSFMFSLTRTRNYYENFLAQGVGMGIGMGMRFLPSLSVPSHYFRRRRGLTMGIIMSGDSVGAVVYPIMLNHLFATVGFAWAVRIVSFLGMGLLVSAGLLMRTRLPPTRPDGSAYSQLKKIIGDLTFSLSRMTLVTNLSVLFQVFCIQLFATLHNESGIIVTYIVSRLALLPVFALSACPTEDRDIHSTAVLIPITFVSGYLVFVMLAATDTGILVVFAVLHGFFSSADILTIAVYVPSVADSLPIVGSLSAPAYASFSFGLRTGNPTAGALLNPPHYEWIKLLLFSAVSFCFSLSKHHSSDAEVEDYHNRRWNSHAHCAIVAPEMPYPDADTIDAPPVKQCTPCETPPSCVFSLYLLSSQ
ncbi:hypothetical protein CONPUDRAFT_59234, partial [Coniophora puteana RWD-64-598 SS2]